MANKNLFKSTPGRTVPPVDTTNAAGGKAYSLSPKAALARYAATGCISNTYYVKAEDHLDRILDLAGQCEPEFIAKLAVYARKEGHMKDMPALLLAHLATRGDEGRGPLKAAFPVAIDNGRMLRNFVQIMRSGRLGRKSMGSGPRNLVRGFLTRNKPHWLFRQLSVGKEPSGTDIIKMVHPKGSPEHDALFGYLIGKVKPGSEKWEKVPELVKQFEAWKADRDLPPPPVPFELLTAQPLTADQWAAIFQHGGWHFVRMNLNTAARHGVLERLKQPIALKLKDEETIRKARVMPYQLLATYRHATDVPRVIVEAIHDALEISVSNVPPIEGQTLVIVDVSGSMSCSVTGGYGTASSKVRCVDVAALFAAAIARQNPETIVLPVDTRVHEDFRPEPRNTIITEADRLSRFGGGGTAIAYALSYANKKGIRAQNVVIISDQESWADYGHYRQIGTLLTHEWEAYLHRNRTAKLVCVDIVPGRTHQVQEGRPEILHVAGWNDSVFKVVASFLNGTEASWLDIVERIDLSLN